MCFVRTTDDVYRRVVEGLDEMSSTPLVLKGCQSSASGRDIAACYEHTDPPSRGGTVARSGHVMPAGPAGRPLGAFVGVGRGGASTGPVPQGPAGRLLVPHRGSRLTGRRWPQGPCLEARGLHDGVDDYGNTERTIN